MVDGLLSLTHSTSRQRSRVLVKHVAVTISD